MCRPFWSETLAYNKLEARRFDAAQRSLTPQDDAEVAALADTERTLSNIDDGIGVSIALEYLRADLEYVSP